MAFAVAVVENCTVDGRVKSAGINWARSAALGEKDDYKITAEPPRFQDVHICMSVETRLPAVVIARFRRGPKFLRDLLTMTEKGA